MPIKYHSGMNTSIVAAGVKADVGSRVVLWDEDGGLSCYKYGVKHGKRNTDLKGLQKEIDSFVLHHSVTYTAKQTYNALIGRNLSVNFIIDDDDVDGVATIYQCLDIKDAGQSQAPFNMRAPGVEISYMPIYKSTTYSEHNRKSFKVNNHPVCEHTVHGQTFKVFGPSEPQVKALLNLLYGFHQLFPAVDLTLPKGPDGKVAKTVIKNPKGLLYHSHITTNKIDPAGLPDDFEAQLAPLLVYGP